MKRIKLTDGRFALVDNADFDWLNQWRWNGAKSGYASRGEYIRGSGRKNQKKNYFYMHRVVMDAPSDKQVDHIDGNRLNNQRSNLRLCTQSQNNMNMKPRKNFSGYKGVHYDKRKKSPWVAHVKKNGKTISRYYSTALEAARGYDKLAIAHFGEFARPNLEVRIKS